jgi:hypothetical protein
VTATLREKLLPVIQRIPTKNYKLVKECKARGKENGNEVSDEELAEMARETFDELEGLIEDGRNLLEAENSGNQ